MADAGLLRSVRPLLRAEPVAPGRNGLRFYISIVCVIQTLIALWHLQKGVPVTVRENAVFLILYVGCGILDFRSALDVLPIIASIFNMWATFQKDVHKSRILILMNASSFFVYYLLLGSTACIAELIAIATAIFTIRKKRTKRDGDPLP